jgi:hypothetical protein
VFDTGDGKLDRRSPAKRFPQDTPQAHRQNLLAMLETQPQQYYCRSGNQRDMETAFHKTQAFAETSSRS